MNYRILRGGLVDDHHRMILHAIIKNDKIRIAMQRLGSSNDGGYWIPTGRISTFPWVSIGLGFNCDFENDLAKNGTVVNTFDHTIKKRPSNLNPSVSWHKLGYGATESNNLTNLIGLTKHCTDLTFGQWNLKFDIEGSEYGLMRELIDTVAEVNLPSIVVCELHKLLYSEHSNPISMTIKDFSRFYVPCFSTGNNFSALVLTESYTLYDCVEVTWVRRDLVSEFQNLSLETSFPSVNNPLRPSFELRLA